MAMRRFSQRLISHRCLRLNTAQAQRRQDQDQKKEHTSETPFFEDACPPSTGRAERLAPCVRHFRGLRVPRAPPVARALVRPTLSGTATSSSYRCTILVYDTRSGTHLGTPPREASSSAAAAAGPGRTCCLGTLTTLQFSSLILRPAHLVYGVASLSTFPLVSFQGFAHPPPSSPPRLPSQSPVPAAVLRQHTVGYAVVVTHGHRVPRPSPRLGSASTPAPPPRAPASFGAPVPSPSRRLPVPFPSHTLCPNSHSQPCTPRPTPQTSTTRSPPAPTPSSASQTAPSPPPRPPIWRSPPARSSPSRPITPASSPIFAWMRTMSPSITITQSE